MWGRRFLNHSNIEAVLNERQPGGSPRTTKPTDVTSDAMAFAELKFALEKWRKGELDVSPNDVKRGVLL